MITLVIIFAYFLVAMDTARRVAWAWNNSSNKNSIDSDAARRALAILCSLVVLPIMLVLAYTAHDGVEGFDKPPRAVRKKLKEQERETKLIEARRMVDDLQEEIDRLARQ